MKFAREEVRDAMKGVGWLRRQWSALVVSIAAAIIFTSMIRPRAYADAGLDAKRAVATRRSNEHFHSMVRSSCAHLMSFLDEAGLLTKPAARIYRKVHML